jgi:amidase
MSITTENANMWDSAGVARGLSDSWSGRCGQCWSIFFPNADPRGSSSGSSVAASSGLAAVSLGTETDLSFE